mmetsp:Transcript_21656/g.56522  ORF Transcript_21656/g.56522 Transcript_21656/m.56522 type:complete len:420 (+) Transcript_21656:281-1540(+)
MCQILKIQPLATHLVHQGRAIPFLALGTASRRATPMETVSPTTRTRPRATAHARQRVATTATRTPMVMEFQIARIPHRSTRSAGRRPASTATATGWRTSRTPPPTTRCATSRAAPLTGTPTGTGRPTARTSTHTTSTVRTASVRRVFMVKATKGCSGILTTSRCRLTTGPSRPRLRTPTATGYPTMWTRPRTTRPAQSCRALPSTAQGIVPTGRTPTATEFRTARIQLRTTTPATTPRASTAMVTAGPTPRMLRPTTRDAGRSPASRMVMRMPMGCLTVRIQLRTMRCAGRRAALATRRRPRRTATGTESPTCWTRRLLTRTARRSSASTATEMGLPTRRTRTPTTPAAGTPPRTAPRRATWTATECLTSRTWLPTSTAPGRMRRASHGRSSITSTDEHPSPRTPAMPLLVTRRSTGTA